MAKFDIHAEITNKIIESINAGTPPWRKPWTGSKSGAAFPLRSTGEGYRGINILMLWLAAEERGYSSAHWFTFKQAKDFGANVRKGEKSNTVIKYGTVERENDQGEDVKIPYMRAYRVFNADQIEGLPEQFYITPELPRDLGTVADPALDDFFAALGVAIDTSDKPEAYYSLSTDRIHMPSISTFYNAAEFYGVLGHEAAHATGHKSRLDRFEKFQNRKDYAFEELVAEIATCILGAEFGFKPDFGQSAAYIEGWLSALNDDHSVIFKAASEAQKAVDFIKAKASEATEKEVAA
ncbi:antirestriction protein [Rhodobacterales bacterium 52_120_T64]|nr:antirestriction protein [Rhodobacterales bacterium 52_120_T64]